jgi:AraC-like DNA-binding protein
MNTEFEGVSGPDFIGLTISISEPHMTSLADRIGLPLPDDFLRRVTLPVRRRTKSLRHLRETGFSLLHRRNARFDASEQEDLVAGLICATADAEKFDDQSTLSVRVRSVRRALDYIRSQVGDDILVSDLCAFAAVSLRTLERGFKEQFGIGPKAYLNQFRLAKVRSMLLKAPENAGVADIANKWDFWHMGQFASDYRRMFGELPSETLKRKQR